MKQRFEIDEKGLKEYLSSLCLSEIERDWQKPEIPKLIEGKAMDDIEFFKMDIKKVSPERLINYGEPFLVDIIGNDLSVVMLTRRKYKSPNGRVLRAKFITTIIDDCRKLYGTPLNGYWIIPKQFVKWVK